jgi:hypothetical protein
LTAHLIPDSHLAALAIENGFVLSIRKVCFDQKVRDIRTAEGPDANKSY